LVEENEMMQKNKKKKKKSNNINDLNQIDNSTILFDKLNNTKDKAEILE
jgi:hypothetical protein